MQKVLIVVLSLALIGCITCNYLQDKEDSIVEEVSYNEILETDQVYTTELIIEKGEYLAGDVFYLTYSPDTEEAGFLDVFIIKVAALEKDDVIAYHEITEEESNTLKEKNLNISVELSLTEEEVEVIGAQNLSKHIRANKVSNSNEEEKLQIKNKFEEKETEYIQYKQEKNEEKSNSSQENDSNNSGNEGNDNNNSDINGSGNADTNSNSENNSNSDINGSSNSENNSNQ